MLSSRIKTHLVLLGMFIFSMNSWFLPVGMFGQQFADVTLSQGINVSIDPIITGNSVSFYDWNYDGWDDLTFCQINQPPQFFQNTGEEFVEVASFVESQGICRQVSWVDFDNDGDADLFLTFEDQPMELHENDGEFGFTNITCQAGFPETYVRNYGFCWGDYDIDGYLDVFVSVYWDPSYDETYELENHLFKNNGDGTFSDVTIQSNASDGHTFTLAPIWWDYDKNGHPDLYVVNDKWSPNTLLKNDGSGNFSDVSQATGTDIIVDGMSATPGDFDHNGWPDMYVTSTQGGNVLLAHDGIGSYSDVTFDTGVGTFEDCWGAAWFDPDLDTDLDLYVTTQGGWNNGAYLGKQNYFYENSGFGDFSLMHNSVGLQNDDAHSHCVAIGDYNRDGLPDFAISNVEPFLCQLWKNTTETENNFIGISLQGTISNREAVGSWIHVYAGGELWSQYTHSSENYLSQNSMRKIFGLGELATVDSVVINWPNGLEQNFGSLAVGNYHHLIEGYEDIPPILFDDDLIICDGESLTLSTDEYSSYLWSTGDTTQSIVVSEAGTYYVTVENQLGFLQPSDPVEVWTPQPFEWQVTNYPILCAGDANGALEFASAGEQGPVENLQWMNDIDELIGSDSLLSDLDVGIYQLLFSDEYGCIWTGEYTITEPPAIGVTWESQNVSCYGLSDGAIQAFPFGGTGELLLDWNGEDLSALEAGDYSFIITDELGCSFTQDYSIQQPAEITIESEIEHVSCYGETDGFIGILAMGGTGSLQIDWSNIDQENLSGGNYTIFITDSVGCSVEYDFDIEEPEALEVTINTTEGPDGFILSTDVIGGTPPYYWEWSDGSDESSAEFPEDGVYSVLVTDTNGCEHFSEILVTDIVNQDRLSEHLFPNPASDYVMLVNNGHEGFDSWSIYSETGQLVLTSSKLWLTDPRIDISVLLTGSYFIVFRSREHSATYQFIKR